MTGKSRSSDKKQTLKAHKFCAKTLKMDAQKIVYLTNYTVYLDFKSKRVQIKIRDIIYLFICVVFFCAAFIVSPLFSVSDFGR